MKRDPEEYLDSDEYILRSGAAERIKQPADYTALLALTPGGLDDPHGLQDCIIRAAEEAKHSKK